ncbi:transcription factor far1 [Plakobranchus ocellatus]|uniref:Transcription factor far1 n=1 Tax=Plakobranchus ocellatus TaxID=259542 RepID=A0AAV3Z5M1_9GAST|nr:transcription factor far1 [Plakobranchus ocellatus]
MAEQQEPADVEQTPKNAESAENETAAEETNEEENEEANEDENEQDGDEETEGVNGTAGDTVDTTAEFLKIFQGKTEFSSWEEFNTLFEEFQKETGSAFKPRSATSIEFANERRVRDIIPAHFVYQTVKMVCQHFGSPPVAKDGSTRKPRKYVGLGCEAMIHLSYKGGSLNIISCNLEHKNHALFSGNEVFRKVRSFSFTDDVDYLMAKVVMEHNPFSHWNSEKEWIALVEDLQSRDERMKTVTIRIVKKRIRFLIDRYMANSNGKAPLPDDEMGIILYELAKAKQDAMDNISRVARKPGTGRKRGRPRKHPLPETDDDEDFEAMLDADDSATYSPADKKVKKYGSTTPSYASSSGPPPIKDIAVFLRYMERKDDNDRRLKQDDIDLRRGELELHKKELELQRERFEFERLERQAHLDLLKAQLEVLTSQRSQQQQQQPQQQKLVLADPKGDGSEVTEYTIVLNNDQAFATQ